VVHQDRFPKLHRGTGSRTRADPVVLGGLGDGEGCHRQVLAGKKFGHLAGINKSSKTVKGLTENNDLCCRTIGESKNSCRVSVGGVGTRA